VQAEESLLLRFTKNGPTFDRSFLMSSWQISVKQRSKRRSQQDLFGASLAASNRWILAKRQGSKNTLKLVISQKEPNFRRAPFVEFLWDAYATNASRRSLTRSFQRWSFLGKHADRRREALVTKWQNNSITGNKAPTLKSCISTSVPSIAVILSPACSSWKVDINRSIG